MTESERAFLAFVAIGVFSVDREGRVWRRRRLIAGSHAGTPPYWKDIPARLAECSMSDGYPTVMFSDGTVRHKVFAHRVVWMVAKQADIPAGLQIDHKNRDRTDHRPDNLEMVTASENVKRAIPTRKPAARSGESNPCATLTERQVLEIRALAGKMAQSRIAAMFGTKQQTVSNIIQRRSWAHLP